MESGSSSTILWSTPSILPILRASVLVGRSLTMMSMIGKRGRTAKAHISWSIKIHQKTWLKWKSVLLKKRTIFCRLWTSMRIIGKKPSRLSARKNLPSHRKMAVPMWRTQRRRGRRWRSRWSRSRWSGSTRVKTILTWRPNRRWWRTRNGRRLRRHRKVAKR